MEWWQIVLLILGSIITGILVGALVTYLIGRFAKKPLAIPLAGAKIGEELEAKVIAKREAEEAKRTKKAEAKQRAKQLIEEARDRTKQESEESARIMAEEKQEAEQANKEGEEGTKEELEVVEPMAEVAASAAPTQGDSPRLYEGMLELEITALDADQISYLISHLRQVSFLQVVSLSGSTN